ncbi:uncharacterized protein EI97DRAFT_377448 [Westerdykella ornata]|uniref:4-carboxymuconolactone decarboxylase-like protein n=1 Tax=Westerdykella ornata TaxID=318751 RepID=A0A6A6JIF3_WESOR|nr:uncharacterized protein EI97DRAFT_377448 [Westerdykella ornata]KAF2276341.1 hypothetical protein EI97DRAFT_377448 [Westerdykella ornata]
MRFPYVEDPPTVQSEEEKAIVDRVRQRRGSAGLLELDRALLHAPPVADGWNSFLGAIRTGTSISSSIRELAICRVAVLNKAWYEWEHHAPLLQACTGIGPEHIDAVRKTPAKQFADVFNEPHSAVMTYTDAMTLDVSIPDDIFERLKKIFSNKEIVEITATISAYNCVSRFLVALDVGERNEQRGPNDH